MKLFVLLGSSVLLAPLIAFFLLSGATAPLWLLAPALLFAVLIGATIVAQQWLRLLGVVALQLLIVVFAFAMAGLCIVALTTVPTPHWIVWAVLVTALLALLVGIKPVSTAAPAVAQARHA